MATDLVELVEQSVGRFAERPVFGRKQNGRWEWTTYRELGAAIAAARAGLHELGLRSGDRLAIIADNSCNWAAAAHGAWSLGAVVVPMYESQREQDWIHILRDSGATIVCVAGPRVAARLHAIAAQLPDVRTIVSLDIAHFEARGWDELITLGAARPIAALHPGADALAAIIYTSGTTGRPKGVELCHGNITSNVEAMLEAFDIGPEDRSLAFLPWAHVFGLTVELHGMISVGAAMAIAESRDALVANLAEVRPTILISVPHVFNRIYDRVRARVDEEGGLRKRLFDAAFRNAAALRLAQAEGRPRPLLELAHRFYDALVFRRIRARFGGRLRYAFSGGAALSPLVARFIDDLGTTVYEGYGLTETSPVVAANSPRGRKLGSVGRPIPGVRVEIDEGVGTRPGEGEIVVYGRGVMRGYRGLPEATAATLTDRGGLRTGDLGRIDEDGYLWITGRIKEQYKLQNGKYSVPGPIEAQLQLSPYVLGAFVWGDNKPFNIALLVPHRERLRAWVREQELDVADDDALLAHDRVRARLAEEVRRLMHEVASFERVRDFAVCPEEFTVENGLLTPTLKLKRAAVLERHRAAIDAIYTHHAGDPARAAE